MGYTIVNGELYHYGVKGMKWGVRRYQNPDGTLTAAGKRRAIKQEAKAYRKELYKEHNFTRKLAKEESKNWEKEQLEDAGIKTGLTDKQKKMIKTGAAYAAIFVGSAAAGFAIAKIQKRMILKKEYERGYKAGEAFVKNLGAKAVDINKVNVNTTPVNKTRLNVSDLTEGTKLIKKMQSDGSNISKEIKNNQYMSRSLSELEKSIKNAKAVNAKRQSLGMTGDDSVLAKMELAYMIKKQAELLR